MRMIGSWFGVAVFLIALLMGGCDYILTQPGAVCEPPNKLVTDIYGNQVCVTPEETGLPAEEAPAPVINGSAQGSTGTTAGGEAPSEVATPPEEQAPTEVPPQQDLEGIPKKVVTEGDLVSFPNLRASDPDGDQVTYTFDLPLDSKGEWQTMPGDAGNYLTTITASDGQNKVEQKVLIVVNQKNNPPSVTGLSAQMVVDEGDTIRIRPIVSDPDGDEVTVRYSGWMKNSTYKTTYDDSGRFAVFVTASDGITEVTKEIEVVVNNVNRAPVLEGIDDLKVEIGDTVILKPKAQDPDSDEIVFSFTEPFDQGGRYTAVSGEKGTYQVTVTASDGKEMDKATFTLTVGTPNLPPVFESLDDIEVSEGETVRISPCATDPEGEQVTFTYSGWMTSSVYSTTYKDSGNYEVTVVASDGVNEVRQTILVTVNDINRPPQFNPDWLS